ncbi:hypothetical protein CRG98_036194 [Punica granatum]|uniref:Uncharacterized protein n=1 Tax=Punica granatum TaxID=22663 RepID=A0A2I0IHE7_PUNGR|nr:hypothetical protein CRG98_036194 [Punica granatum]
MGLSRNDIAQACKCTDIPSTARRADSEGSGRAPGAWHGAPAVAAWVDVELAGLAPVEEPLDLFAAHIAHPLDLALALGLAEH